MLSGHQPKQSRPARPARAGWRVWALGVVLIGVAVAWPVLPARAMSFGPFSGRLSVEAGLEYTDNLNNTETNRIQNLYWLFGPVFNGGLALPVRIVGTGGEQLRIDAAASYNRKYSLNGNKHEEGFSGPVNVSLTFPLRIFHWTFLLWDNFSFRNDPLERFVAIADPSSEEYNNTAGASLSRSFGRAALDFSASRQDKFSPDVPETEEVNYQLSVTPSVLIREQYSVFWRTTYGMYLPEDPKKQESRGLTTEIGVNGQLTPFLSGTLSIGYGVSWLDQRVLGPGDGIFGGIFDRRQIPDDRVDGITSTVGLNYLHPLNPNTTYAISFFRSPGVTAALKDSNITEVYGVRLAIAHQLRRDVVLTPNFGWVHSEDVGKEGAGEVSDLFYFGLGFRRRLTARITFEVDYRFQARLSNQEGDSYETNRLSVKARYDF